MERFMNIASGKPVSIKNVVEKVVNASWGGKPNFRAVPYRSGKNMELYADISLAKKILNWKPKTSLDQGLKETVNYLQKWLKPK